MVIPLIWVTNLLVDGYDFGDEGLIFIARQ